MAANLFVAPSLGWTETFTTNANFGLGGQPQSDVISELVPSLVLFALTKNLQVNVRMQVIALDYLHGTMPDVLLPNGGVLATFEALDRHFFLEGAATATQSQSDVFAATPAAPSSYNTFTTESYRLSPYFKGDLPGQVRYVVRSDNALERASGSEASSVNSRLTTQSIDLDRMPHPLGWGMHAEAWQTDYTDDTTPIIRQELGEAILKVAPDPRLTFSPRGGIEQENFLLDTRPRAVYGGGLLWEPDDRTKLEGLAQHQFFGTQWTYGFRHREPFLIVNMTGWRDVVTTAQTLLLLPPGGDMAGMLDVMLTPSYPDPVERAAAVQAMMALQNLPQSTAAGSTIYTTIPMLVTSNKAAITWLGRRDAVSLSGYILRTQDVPSGMNPEYNVGALTAQTQEAGGDLTATHHLTPFTSVTASGVASEIEGIGLTSGEYTREFALTLSLAHLFSPRTTGFVATRLQAISSNVTPDAREKAVLIGLSHRF
ncbi:MAG TPA: TIGR03016 family PEP-CTERM system-associated outer membrane protein [Burkholderiaceae bacterium]|nr:TIGR03016 family PEP-CTERM system-associated outer membrane protein [Burkholderiaceae bacterium]